MNKYLLAAVAAASLASPALARDGQPYVGLEGGYIVKADTDFDVELNGVDFDDAVELDYKNGYDLDAVAGYDFGAVRAEAELGYKRLKIDNIEGITAFNSALGQTFDINDVDDRASVLSGMLNVLFDIGDAPGVSFYAGGGAGVARVKAFDEKGTTLAWQLLAGLRAPVSDNVDVGLKYRYFNASADFDDNVAGLGFNTDGKLTSHSILASLIFNFGAPAAPVVYAPAPAAVVAPFPAPAPVTTQTCYDGTVIPATGYCPLPPQPQVPRAGERG